MTTTIDSIQDRIKISTFRDVSTRVPKVLRTSWRELCAQLEDPPEYSAKDQCPLLKLAVWKPGGSRTDANLVWLNGIEGDYDAGIVSPLDASMSLRAAGIRAIIYTTPSHCPEKPRWRVLAPLSRPHGGGTHKALLDTLDAALGRVLARESWTRNRIYYYGRVTGAEYAAYPVEGQCIDEAHPLASLSKSDARCNSTARRPMFTVPVPVLPLPPAEEERLRGALAVLPSDDRGYWIKTGLILKPYGDAGRELWEEWSRKSAKWKPEDAERWGGLKPDGSISVGTIFMDAKRAGWADPYKVNGADHSIAGPHEVEEEDKAWPRPLDDAAFHGIAGEIARAIAPLTESDTAAILIQTLVAFGAAVGRASYWAVENDTHYCNLFALIVGTTSNARKGVSWGRVRSIFERLPQWVRVWDGDLSTGEGLKFQVRDPSVKIKKSRSKGAVDVAEYDEGIADKRLLIIASEFGYALKVMSRQGNTLSATLRQAWDHGTLGTMTRTDPITATNAHIAIIGHVTPEELVKELADSDANNGFMNRFLLVCSKKSQDLPLGGEGLSEGLAQDFAARLGKMVGQAHHGSVRRTPDADEVWRAAYGELGANTSGLVEKISSRAHPLTMRLALIYALLDGKAEIDAVHIKAALAVWEYCARSAEYVFGGATLGNRYADPARGSDLADRIERILKMTPGGMTLMMLNRRFGNHLSVGKRDLALASLEESGIARCEKRRVEGTDKPTTWWFYGQNG